MLQSLGIEALVDVRRFPGSLKYPWFNQDALQKVLEAHAIRYIHMEALGGRRNVQPGSRNSAWRNGSFRGYADYMETEAFQKAAEELEATGRAFRTAYMCSEAVWWRCHRSMISDYLKARGWTVLHIMGIGKTEEHRYTAPARVSNGSVCYWDKDLFNS